MGEPDRPANAAPSPLPETPYFGRPLAPFLLGLALTPPTALFVYTMGALIGGAGPTEFLSRMAAVYIIPLALSPFAAMWLLFMHRAWRLFQLHRRGRPGHARVLSLEADTRTDGSPTGRTRLHARVDIPDPQSGYDLKARLKAPLEQVKAALPPEGVPILCDPIRPRRVLIDPLVPGARY